MMFAGTLLVTNQVATFCILFQTDIIQKWIPFPTVIFFILTIKISNSNLNCYYEEKIAYSHNL